MQDQIKETEQQIWDLTAKLHKLRSQATPVEVKNYTFQTLEGKVTLLDLFAGKDTLFAIHNMGQGCSYCTLWADELNANVKHLEDRFSVVLLSQDSPEVQRRFANERGWRFRMASHGGGEYITEQSINPKASDSPNNYPGLVCYTRKGDQIFKKNATEFGPGDQFCSQWHILSLAGVGEEEWTPQYSYWRSSKEL